jgi:putative transposase
VYQAQREAGVEPEDRVRPLSGIDLRNLWTAIKPEWASEHSWWIYDQASRDASTAMTNFLKGTARFPTFAKKNVSKERFTIYGRECEIEAARLRLPKIGWIKISSADPAQARLRSRIRKGTARLLSVTVTLRSDGHWWATLKILAIRLGIVDFRVVSHGGPCPRRAPPAHPPSSSRSSP